MNPDNTQLDIHVPISAEQYQFLKDWAHHMRCPIGELVVACAMNTLAADEYDGEEQDKGAVIVELILESLRKFIDSRKTPDPCVPFDR